MSLRRERCGADARSRYGSLEASAVFVFATKIRYDAALTSRNGLLGDWGSVTGAFELRRTFGARRDGPRFQPGVYAQGFWFWDPVELEIPGVTDERFDRIPAMIEKPPAPVGALRELMRGSRD